MCTALGSRSTRPPADLLLDRVFRATRNVALVLPPTLNMQQLDGLPRNERQQLYMDGNRELYCLYFGDLATCFGRDRIPCVIVPLAFPTTSGSSAVGVQVLRVRYYSELSILTKVAVRCERDGAWP